MQEATLGITGQPAPEWNVGTWFRTEPVGSSLRMSDIDTPVVYLYCFQAWCPGCHSHGFPTMAAVKSRFNRDHVSFVAIQTVFEGFDVNTAENGLAATLQHGLDDIAVGHDPGADGVAPAIMRAYRTGGTPWTVIIGPERTVRFNGFTIDAPMASVVIEQLLD